MKYCIKLLCILVLFVLPLHLESCGYFTEGVQNTMNLFRPRLRNYEALTPFYLHSNTYYDNVFYNGLYQELQERPISELSKQWFTYVDGQVELELIDSVLFDMPAQFFFEHLDRNQVDAFTTYLQRKKPDAFAYLLQAKSIERLGQSDRWDNEAMDTLAIKIERQKVDSILNLPHDGFMLRKWRFSALRLTKLLNDSTRFFAQYADWFENESTPSPERALLEMYCADLSVGAKRNVHLVRSFLTSTVRQMRSKERYDKRFSEEAMALTTSTREKATHIVLSELDNPGKCLIELKKIYVMDPQNPFLDFMLIREINKIENWMLAQEHTGNEAFSEWNYRFEREFYIYKQHELNKKYIREFSQFLQGIVRDEKQDARRALWISAQAELALLIGEPHRAKAVLEQALPFIDPGLQVQIDILRTMIELQLKKTWDAELESLVMTWVKKEKEASKQLFDKTDIYSAAFSYIAKWCNDHHRADLAYCFYMHSNKSHDILNCVPWGYCSPKMLFMAYAHDQDYKNLISLHESERRSDWSTWIVDYDQFPSNAYLWDKRFELNRVKEFYFTYLVREDRLDDAIALAQTVDEHYWKKETDVIEFNPFVLDVYRMERKPLRLTKPQFLEHLVALKSKPYEDPEKESGRLFALANAYYAMTFNGNAWMMMHDYKSWDASNYVCGTTSNLEDIWWGCSRAKPYFENALKLSSNKDIAYASGLRLVECENSFRALRNKQAIAYSQSQAFDLLNAKDFDTAEWLKCDGKCENMVYFVQSANQLVAYTP